MHNTTIKLEFPQNSDQFCKVIDSYKTATAIERKAIINHIDNFISSSFGDQKVFWLRVRRGLERINENVEKINSLDKILGNISAVEKGQRIITLQFRHQAERKLERTSLNNNLEQTK